MTTPESSIRIALFKDSSEPFRALLSESGIEFVQRAPRPGAIMASGEWLEVLKTASISAPLAGVVISFLKHRHGRKVIITCGDRTILHAENLTHEELIDVLDRAASVTAIDTGKAAKPDDKSEDANEISTPN